MPLIDMPLTELYTYTGRNPRPADFDAYWDRALGEMHALGTECTLIPAEYKLDGCAEFYDLYFTGVGGAKVHAKYARPAHIEGRLPAVLLFHGYTGASPSNWTDLLRYTAAGFCAFALDCRGQAGRSQDVSQVIGNTHNGHIIRGLCEGDPDKLLYRALFLDTAQLARIAMALPEVDESRVGATGGSQGGGLTIACASLEPKIKRAAPCVPFLSDYKRVWEMDLAKGAYAELKWFFRAYDPQHLREDEIFTQLGYIDIEFLAPRIKADLMMTTGLMDEICPPSTQFAAYNKMTCNKRVLIYPDFAHEDMPGNQDDIIAFMRGM